MESETLSILPVYCGCRRVRPVLTVYLEKEAAALACAILAVATGKAQSMITQGLMNLEAYDAETQEFHVLEEAKEVNGNCCG